MGSKGTGPFGGSARAEPSLMEYDRSIHMKKITVYFGNYGSGKTELSLETVLRLRAEHENVMLVDIDIVNPYFRSSEKRKMLENMGIRVVSPVYANTAVDVPSLPPDIYAAFRGSWAVFDCGGDPVGASALGSLKPQFDAAREDTEVLFVVNTRRPFQQNAAELIESLGKIERNARLKADGVVLNANLGPETTGEELLEGYEIVRELERQTGIPLRRVTGTQEALAAFAEKCPDCSVETMSLTIRMRPDWMQSTGS